MSYDNEARAKQISVRICVGRSIMSADLSLPIGLDAYEKQQLARHLNSVCFNGPFDQTAMAEHPYPETLPAGIGQIIYLVCTRVENHTSFGEFVTKVILQNFHVTLSPILVPMEPLEEMILLEMMENRRYYQ